MGTLLHLEQYRRHRRVAGTDDCPHLRPACGHARRVCDDPDRPLLAAALSDGRVAATLAMRDYLAAALEDPADREAALAIIRAAYAVRHDPRAWAELMGEAMSLLADAGPDPICPDCTPPAE